MRLLVLFPLLFICQISWSLTPFQKHVVHASQAFSSLYMYELSEGDQNYLRSFKKDADLALSFLNNADDNSKQKYLARWHALQPLLKYDSTDSRDIYFNVRTRMTARDYLTDLYLDSNDDVNDITRRLDKLQVLTNIVTAREIDMSLFNRGGLSSHNIQLDHRNLLIEINEKLAVIMKTELSKKQHSRIKKVQTRIKFISKGMATNGSAVPYYLIYSSVQSINKLLTASL